MYATKHRTTKTSSFQPSKEEAAKIKAKEESKSGTVSENPYAPIKEKVDPKFADPKFRCNFKMQPPKKGQTTGYFGNLPKDDKKGSKPGDNNHYKNLNSQYFLYEGPGLNHVGAPKLRADAKTKEKPISGMGFGSKDIPKSHEFCNQVRQSQWKELMKVENTFQANWAKSRAIETDSLDEMIPKHEQARFENENRKAQGLPEHFQNVVPTTLYDIGKTEHTPICNKCKKETFYCTHRVGAGIVHNRRLGGSEYKTSSHEVGGRVWGVSAKPSYGRVRTTKSFDDNSHLGY
jgi:hypothetical protein